MSQVVFNTIIPSVTSGNQLAALLNGFKDAVVSGFCGTARPSQLQPGGYWVDITNDATGTWDVRLYDGVQNILVYTVDKTNGKVSAPGTVNAFEIFRSTDDILGPMLNLMKERASGLGQVLAGDDLGSVRFNGTQDDGTQVVQARIRAASRNNVTVSAQGSVLLFETIALGSAALVEGMRLQDGKLGIGTLTPAESLHVAGNIKSEKISDDAVGTKIISKKQRFSGFGQVQNGDIIFSHSFRSTDNAGADIETAYIEVAALELHTSTAQGTGWKLRTKKIGSAALADRIVVDSSGVSIPELKSGSGGGVTLSAVQNIPADGTISLGTGPQQIIKVQGDAGPQSANVLPMTSNPENGTILIIEGQDDSKVLGIFHNDSAWGFILKAGDCYLGANDTLMVYTDVAAQRYKELTRSIH